MKLVGNPGPVLGRACAGPYHSMTREAPFQVSRTILVLPIAQPNISVGYHDSLTHVNIPHQLVSILTVAALL